MSDSAVLQEVDEAVRKDDLKLWWNRYGTLVVAGAVAAVVVAAGAVGWRQYDAGQRATASAAYSMALAKIGPDVAAARADLEKQATDAREPYRSLAALIVAQLQNTPEEQVAALTAVAAKLSVPELADLATVIAALKSVDTPKADEMAARLDPLAGPDRPFRVSVREVQALAAVRKGDAKRARELWGEIAKDPGTPQGAAQRASAMLNLYAAAEAK
ncbi:MAG: tetratricopeptide repeat protein [Reyranella sp.]|nr:tetratricopeptide repeat protein [Reyranella sp.]